MIRKGVVLVSSWGWGLGRKTHGQGVEVLGPGNRHVGEEVLMALSRHGRQHAAAPVAVLDLKRLVRLEMRADGHDVDKERPVLVGSGVLDELNGRFGHDICGVLPGHVVRRLIVLLISGVVVDVHTRLNQD